MTRAVILLSVVLVAGCGGGSTSPARPAGVDAPPTGALGRVTVLAASSLTEAFTTLGKLLETEHPGTKVQFSFAASSELATQVVNGAPADVFASAAMGPMKQVVDTGSTHGGTTTFASNRLEIAVPPGNPGRVRGLVDFAREDLKIALCAPEVPCGAVSTTAFTLVDVEPRPDTLEPDVKAALAKVILGEVDAALVYRTDVEAAGSAVEGIEFPRSEEAVTDYPIVLLDGAPNPRGGRAFVDLVLSREGQAVLTDAGFELP